MQRIVAFCLAAVPGTVQATLPAFRATRYVCVAGSDSKRTCHIAFLLMLYPALGPNLQNSAVCHPKRGSLDEFWTALRPSGRNHTVTSISACLDSVGLTALQWHFWPGALPNLGSAGSSDTALQ